jgi:Zn-dependent protease
MQNILNTLYLAAGLAIALMVHEYARAFVAVRLGDQTPRNAGRLTLNPKPHVDPFGTLILPGILLLPTLFGSAAGFLPFAYAKPMPVSTWGLKKPDRDLMLIALAGPIANIALAFVFGALVRTASSGQLHAFLQACLVTTIVIGVLNLVPLPPFDGSRIIARFLPPRARQFYANADQYGAVIVLVIFFIIPGPINAFVNAVGGGICRVVAGGSGCG